MNSKILLLGLLLILFVSLVSSKTMVAELPSDFINMFNLSNFVPYTNPLANVNLTPYNLTVSYLCLGSVCYNNWPSSSSTVTNETIFVNWSHVVELRNDTILRDTNASQFLHLNQDNFFHDDWIIYDTSNYNFTFNQSKLSSVYINVTNASIIAGTIDAGTIENTQHSDGSYDSITINFTEVSGSPALDIRMNFTNVERFDRGIMRYKTSSLAGNIPTIQVWSYDDSAWEDYPSVGESIGRFATITQPIFDSEEHIQNGVVQMRLYKESNGNTNNHYYVDWVALISGFGVPAGEEVDPYSIHIATINHTQLFYETVLNINGSYIWTLLNSSIVYEHNDSWVWNQLNSTLLYDYNLSDINGQGNTSQEIWNNVINSSIVFVHNTSWVLINENNPTNDTIKHGPWSVGAQTIYNNTEGVQVGIGTSTPTNKLEVNGTMKVNGTTNLNNTLYVTANSKVGIGISDPSSPLQVKSSGANSVVFSVKASDEIIISEYSEDGSGNGIINIFDTDGNADIVLSTSGTSSFKAGNLNINDDVQIGQGASNDDDYLFFDQSAAEYLMWDDNPGKFYLTDDLEIVGSFIGDGSALTGMTTNQTIKHGSWSVGAQTIYNDTAGVQVGIGTSTPTNKLEVNGTMKVNGTVNLNNTVYVTDSKVGIGTATPRYDLDVNGRTYLGSSTESIYILDGGSDIQLIGYDGSGYNDIDIRAQLDTQLYLKTDGNVGIGTPAPGHTLHLNTISGSINMSSTGELNMSGNLIAKTGMIVGIATQSLQKFSVTDTTSNPLTRYVLANFTYTTAAPSTPTQIVSENKFLATSSTFLAQAIAGNFNATSYATILPNIIIGVKSFASTEKTTAAGTTFGVVGEAYQGANAYGVYGKASGAATSNYGIYSEGNMYGTGTLTILEGATIGDYSGENLIIGDSNCDANGCNIEIEDGSMCVGTGGCTASTTEGTLYVEDRIIMDTDGAAPTGTSGFLTIGDGADGNMGIEIEDGSLCVGDGGCTPPTQDGQVLIEHSLCVYGSACPVLSQDDSFLGGNVYVGGKVFEGNGDETSHGKVFWSDGTDVDVDTGTELCAYYESSCFEVYYYASVLTGYGLLVNTCATDTGTRFMAWCY